MQAIQSLTIQAAAPLLQGVDLAIPSNAENNPDMI